MRTLLFFFSFIIFSVVVRAQYITEWFPYDLNIQPFTANFLEAKAGFQYLFDIDKARIDIGTSHDFIHWKTDKKTFSIGADFFTYTRARKEQDFKFPVETIDYLFGVNAGYKSLQQKNEWGIRLRFSHISAHLADGNFETDTGLWTGETYPFVYSREFFELLAYYKIYDIRFYGGISYNIHIIPKRIKNETFQIGFDYYARAFKTSSFTPFIAYDFKLTGLENYSGRNIISAGIKFGEPTSRGFSILVSYFSGKSVHGEYFFKSENYTTFGINLDI
jgi:hypothetical protein